MLKLGLQIVGATRPHHPNSVVWCQTLHWWTWSLQYIDQGLGYYAYGWLQTKLFLHIGRMNGIVPVLDLPIRNNGRDSLHSFGDAAIVNFKFWFSIPAVLQPHHHNHRISSWIEWKTTTTTSPTYRDIWIWDIVDGRNWSQGFGRLPTAYYCSTFPSISY